MVPSHNSVDVSLMLREANGTAYSLDFGRPLQGPPGGLQPMQLVVVVGVLDQGERPTHPRASETEWHGAVDCLVPAPCSAAPRASDALPETCRTSAVRADRCRRHMFSNCIACGGMHLSLGRVDIATLITPSSSSDRLPSAAQRRRLWR